MNEADQLAQQHSLIEPQLVAGDPPTQPAVQESLNHPETQESAFVPSEQPPVASEGLPEEANNPPLVSGNNLGPQELTAHSALEQDKNKNKMELKSSSSDSSMEEHKIPKIKGKVGSSSVSSTSSSQDVEDTHLKEPVEAVSTEFKTEGEVPREQSDDKEGNRVLGSPIKEEPPRNIEAPISQPEMVPVPPQPVEAPQVSQQIEKAENSIEEESKVKPPMDDDAQEEEEAEGDEYQDDEDGGMQSQTSIVVEISPKGRFKRFGEELGRGAYKIVFRGVDNDTGREIAWNVINLNRLPKQDRVRIKSEIDLIKKLEHKNIIHFISAWYNKEKEQVVFITEMITGGSLRKYVKRIKTPRLKVIKGWCKEILQGLVYLHEQKPHPIIHRDLKCDNIFINSNSGEIRIGDLGLSTPMQNSFTTSVLGTPEFMAPELYEECYGTGVDIYAFGMCVLEMITLERPYKECQNPAQIYNKVVHGIRPQALDRIKDEEVKEFILQSLNKAATRPSAADLLNSKFLNDLDSEKNNHEVKITKANSSKDRAKLSAWEGGLGHGIQHKKKLETLPEEEENSGDNNSKVLKNGDDNNQIQQQQEQVVEEAKEPLQQEPQLTTTNQMEEGQSEGAAAAEPKVDELAPLQKEISLPIVGQQPQEHLKPEHSMTSMTESKLLAATDISAAVPDDLAVPDMLAAQKAEDEDSVENQVQKKRKRKTTGWSKRLDESVIFLKHIDEQKQIKLLGSTLISKHSHDDDEEDAASNDPHPSTDNILGELIRQDQEEEERKRAFAASAKQPSPSRPNYDSSDHQQPVAAPATKRSDHPRSGDEVASEKKQFGAGKKNFKEDQGLLQKGGPLQGSKTMKSTSATKKQADYGRTTSNDDLKRVNSQSVAQNAQEQKLLTQMLLSPQAPTSNQNSTEKKASQDPSAHHSSDSVQHTVIPPPFPQQQQQNIPPPKPREGAAQPLEKKLDSVFDNQSSSSEDNEAQQDHDSEVDQIQISKNLNYTDDSSARQQQLTQSEQQAKKQAAISQQQQQPVQKSTTFSQSSGNLLSDKVLLKPTPTAPQPKHQSNAQVDKPLGQVGAGSAAPKSGVNYQEGKPTTEAKPQPQIPKTVAVPNPQPAQKPKKEDTPQPPQASQKVSAPPKQSGKFNMSFKIGDKEVTFEFDSNNDTPDGVAQEMVKELRLNQSQVEVISKQIQACILKNSTKPQPPTQPPVALSQAPPPKAPTPQPPSTQPPLQQQQAPKKQSPTKVSKDIALGMFNKLFTDIEYFYSQMQNIGIETTEEIVDAMDCPNDEKNIRMKFFNQVLMAKREYKNQMELYKQKLMQTRKPPIEATPVSDQQPGKGTLKNVQSPPVQGGAHHGEGMPKKASDGTQEESKARHTIELPWYIRKHFKSSPQQFQYQTRLSKPLKKREVGEDGRPLGDLAPDDEVIQLQNILNLLWYDSTYIHSQQNAATKEEATAILQKHVPLRVDGWFGDKTEKCVLKFQKSKAVTMDGLVTEYIWSLMLNHANSIVAEDKRQHNAGDNAAQRLPQAGPTQKESKPSTALLSQPAKLQPAKSEKPGRNSNLQQEKRPPIEVPIGNNQQQQMLSPSKSMRVGEAAKDGVIDYKAMIEQHFVRPSEQNPFQESDHVQQQASKNEGEQDYN